MSTYAHRSSRTRQGRRYGEPSEREHTLLAFLIAIIVAMAVAYLLGPAEGEALEEHAAWYARLREQGACVM